MTSLRLNPFLIKELCDNVIRSRDDICMTKYALSCKEAFSFFEQYVCKNISACFNSAKLEFYDTNVKFEISPLSLLPKMIRKMFMVSATSKNLAQVDNTDEDVFNNIAGNKVIDTIHVSSKFYVNPKFLAACFDKWPTIKTVTCRTSNLLDAADGNIEYLARFDVLNLRGDAKDCLFVLANCYKLPTLHALNLEITDNNINLVDLTFPKTSTLTFLSITIYCQNHTLHYFGSMIDLFQYFPQLEFSNLHICNKGTESLDNLLPNVKKLHSQVKAFPSDVQLIIYLHEKYQNNPKTKRLSHDNDLHELFKYAEKTVPQKPDKEKVKELVAEGYNYYSENLYRCKVLYLNTEFIHDVYFDDPNVYSVERMIEKIVRLTR